MNRTIKALFRTPVYLYRWHMGRLLGHRFLLLTHVGRRTGRQHQTVVELMEYRPEICEAIVMSGFGRKSDWLQNIQQSQSADICIDSQHFTASVRFLDPDEAIKVVAEYERKNRFMLPIIRRVITHLLGWQYNGSEADRRKLVVQLPMIAFRPRITSVPSPRYFES